MLDLIRVDAADLPTDDQVLEPQGPVLLTPEMLELVSGGGDGAESPKGGWSPQT